MSFFPRKPFDLLSGSGKRMRRRRLRKLLADPSQPTVSRNVREGVMFEDPCEVDLMQSTNFVDSSVEETGRTHSNDTAQSDFLRNSSDSEADDKFEQVLDSHIDVCFKNFEKERSQSVDSQLMHWALKFRIKKNALSALLKILKSLPDLSHLPSDYRSFLQTPRTAETKIVGSGEYHHFGIAKTISSALKPLQAAVSNIKLCSNVDGLPLFKSSSEQLWPVLVSINEIPRKVFCVGAYCGEEKPESAEEYLRDYIDELVSLKTTGLTLSSGRHFSVSLFCIICDVPAKAYVQGSKGHTGYSSCSRCKQPGLRIDGRVTFPEVAAEARTHEDFMKKTDKNFHCGVSPFESVPDIDMIKDFSLDYMHLVCLGVMRKMLLLWTFGTVPCRTSASNILLISEKLFLFQQFKPLELCRMPRHLLLINRWKATEFRQFLLYTGPVALKNHLSIGQYENFLTLFIAMRILLSPRFRILPQMLNYARKLMIAFVINFGVLYGPKRISHNVHNVIHLPDDVERFGDLELVSAFRFENYLHTLKGMINKPTDVLQQVIKRVGEMSASDYNGGSNNENESAEKPQFLNECSSSRIVYRDTCAPYYTSVKILNFQLCLNDADCCFGIEDGSIAIAEKISFSPKENSTMIVGREFTIKCDFFTSPCASSLIGIYRVSKLSALKYWHVTSVKKKFVILPYKSEFVVLPLLHTDK